MKLILLRHEKREDYSGYFSNLTDEGLKDSFELEKKLKKIKIDKIFCSPLFLFPYGFFFFNYSTFCSGVSPCFTCHHQLEKKTLHNQLEL